MLKMEDAVAVISRATTPEQSEALARIVYGKVAVMQALKLGAMTDRFEAHRILSYVLMHRMSAENDARYVREQLGLEV